MLWIFNWMPKRLLALFIRLAKYRFWPERRYIPLVRSLAARSEHIGKRINQVDTVLVATRFMAEKLRSFGLKAKRIRHVPFAIDTTLIKRVSIKRSGGELRVGFIGTLSYHKGAHVLVEAVRLLSPALPLKVRIYGAQHQFPEYARTVRDLAARDRRIEFCGTFSNSEIGEVLFELDVLVVPSLWYENSPLVVHSAQAAKVPVVATNVGGMSELITTGENGFLFEREDARALSSIIQLLCNDASLLERLSRSARPPRSITQYVDELAQIYGDVMKYRARA
jgi:glycosyltransferase involved in cell wall biosynthesis